MRQIVFAIRQRQVVRRHELESLVEWHTKSLGHVLTGLARHPKTAKAMSNLVNSLRVRATRSRPEKSRQPTASQWTPDDVKDIDPRFVKQSFESLGTMVKGLEAVR